MFLILKIYLIDRRDQPLLITSRLGYWNNFLTEGITSKLASVVSIVNTATRRIISKHGQNTSGLCSKPSSGSPTRPHAIGLPGTLMAFPPVVLSLAHSAPATLASSFHTEHPGLLLPQGLCTARSLCWHIRLPNTHTTCSLGLLHMFTQMSRH